MSRKRGRFRIGTSGYQYDHWKEVFYPVDLPKKRWFGYYAGHFDTVEINNTFYHLPSPHTFASWKEEAPKDFCYALKFSRYGTHIKRLKDPREPVERFCTHAQPLGETMGPILVQLPPKFDMNLDRLAGFLEVIPSTHRWVIEFRDPRWLREDVYAQLRNHRVALCIHDMIDKHPRELTADWVYLRFHGIHYRGCYSAQTLTAEATRIKDYLARGLDVYAYFNNDAEGYAVRNALDLRRYVLGK